MKIGILGSGNVAQVLGSGYLAKGHEVMLGTRDASKLAEWLKNAGEKATVGTFEDAAKFGEIVAPPPEGEAGAADVGRPRASLLGSPSMPIRRISPTPGLAVAANRTGFWSG